MTLSADQLYELIPAVYRLRDAERGEPLKALTRVIGEQAELVHEDIGQLYENWFIETAQDWVVPYLGDLVGFRRVDDAGEPGDAVDATSRELQRFLFPRREIANLVRLRRRKGTLGVLEDLARNVADWPARAVEFYELLSWFQSVQYPDPCQGKTVDLRDREALARLGSPFERIAHTVDVRRIESTPGLGRFNIPNVGLFVWRRKAYSVTQAPPLCSKKDVHGETCHCFTFSRLGHTEPLYVNPQRETDPFGIATEEHLPTRLRRYLLSDEGRASPTYYGVGKSVVIYVKKWLDEQPDGWWPIPEDCVNVCDLSDDEACLAAYKSSPCGCVALDPQLGLIVFRRGQQPDEVRVSYHYSFSAPIGGGEYDRDMPGHADYPVHRFVPDATADVEEAEQFSPFAADQPQIESNPQNSIHTVKKSVGFELASSEVHRLEPATIRIAAGQTLELRAANRTRPMIEIGASTSACECPMTIQMEPESRLVLDGLLVVATQLEIEEIPGTRAEDLKQQSGCEGEAATARKLQPREVVIRHCTFVPNGASGGTCHGCQEPRGRLIFALPGGRVSISDSIVGAVDVCDASCEQACAAAGGGRVCPLDPVELRITDSIVDGAGKRAAISGQCCSLAHAELTVQRSTLLGRVHADRISAAEDSIFCDLVFVRRAQYGFMRFCYVPRDSSEVCCAGEEGRPDSRTPRRYKCQPETAGQTSSSSCGPDGHHEAVPSSRVRPDFVSKKYGDGGYCQLALDCPVEIFRGAEDESEMGVFHNLYHPQRDARLHSQLQEYTPANMQSAVIYTDE